LEKPAGVKKLVDCNKPMSRMMNGIKVSCPYKSHRVDESAQEPAPKRQKHEACKWTGSFGDLLSKHLADCSCRLISCPNGCGAEIRRGDLAEHEVLCPKKFEQCHICGDLVRPGSMADHRTEKAELHVQILEQKLAAKEEEVAGQQGMEERVVAGIKSNLANLAKTQHVTNVAKQRTEELQRDMRSLAFKKMRWKLDNVAQLLADYPRGQCKRSQSFGLDGIAGLHIIFYPNGKSASLAGKCSVFVSRPLPWEDVYMQIKLSVNGQEKCLVGKDAQWSSGWGFQGATAEEFDAPKRGDSEVIITCEIEDSALVLRG
jgi:hypothetical protein